MQIIYTALGLTFSPIHLSESLSWCNGFFLSFGQLEKGGDEKRRRKEKKEKKKTQQDKGKDERRQMWTQRCRDRERDRLSRRIER